MVTLFEKEVMIEEAMDNRKDILEENREVVDDKQSKGIMVVSKEEDRNMVDNKKTEEDREMVDDKKSKGIVVKLPTEEDRNMVDNKKTEEDREMVDDKKRTGIVVLPAGDREMVHEKSMRKMC